MTQPNISPEQIRRIAEAIASEITSGRKAAPAPGAPAPVSTATYGKGGNGVFVTVDDAVVASRKAFEALDALGLERRKVIVAKMREACLAHAESLAHAAVEESGLGRYEDKVNKNLLVTNKTPGPEDLLPWAQSGDNGLVLIEPAPFGVIGAITPVTNPTSTIINNTIAMVSAGNSVVFNTHPSAKNVSVQTIQILHDAIVAAGGPPNVVSCIAKPTIESAGELMHHPRVRLLVVTGGPAVVKAAMNSGKRAVCAGPGNPPVIVDPTADIEQAGKDVVFGHSFDNNVICVDEKECIVVESVAEALKASMKRNGAVEVPAKDLPRLEKVIFEKNAGPRGHAVVNKKFVGKSAHVILGELGISAGPEVRAVLVEVPNDHPLIWTEQMMPVLPLTRVKNVDEAIDLAVACEGGNFHTACMHSHDLAALSKMARKCNCSIFVKNGCGVDGLSFRGEGPTSFTIASPTGEGLTTPRSFSRFRRCTLRDHFRIV
ncbi:MAG: aldehyde dehydrogenase family protein [Myxococcota bacterium]